MPIPMKTIPPGYLDQPVRADVGRRLMQAVTVLATMRYATYPDLRVQLGDSQHSSSFRKLVNDYLPRYDLAVTCVAHIFGRRNQLGLIRLTERGRRLAEGLGVVPIENDWERIIRKHQGADQPDHTGLLLAFDRRARLRGYTTVLVPDVAQEGFEPDIWIERDGEGLYVEIETAYHRNKPEKWRAARRAQGFAAIVTRTRRGRARLIEDCRASGVAGVVTDFHRLYFEPTAPLWTESWPTAMVSVSIMQRLQDMVGLKSPATP